MARTFKDMAKKTPGARVKKLNLPRSPIPKPVRVHKSRKNSTPKHKKPVDWDGIERKPKFPEDYDGYDAKFNIPFALIRPRPD